MFFVTLEGTYPEGLQEVTVEVLNNTECSKLYGPIITENMMCTSGSNGRGSCFGDSGGPAIVKSPDGFYVQVNPLILYFLCLRKFH